MSQGASLTISGVSVWYGGFKALTDVSADVPAGSLLAVLGANGAGKSTLTRAITGLVPVRDGRISIDDVDITGWKPHRIRRAGVAYIPEGRGIFPALSVHDNLRMGVRQLRSRDARREAIERITELFPVLEERRAQIAGSLSGGEQQMLGLARALAVNPRVMIADEMSLGLAPLVVDSVFERVDAVRREGVTVVLVEQFVHRALSLADQCIVMARGAVAWAGKPEDVGDELLDRYLGREVAATTDEARTRQ